jgi:integrase/recombinase XerD
MLETFFKAPWTIRHLRACSAGAFMDGYAMRLSEASYSRGCARELLRSAAHLSHWLDARDIRLKDWDESALQQFSRHLDHCRCGRVNDGSFPCAVTGARRFLGYLRELGVVRTRAGSEKRRPQFALLDDFCAWLRQHRGASEATVKVYSQQVGDYLCSVGGRADRISASTLRRFVMRRAARAGRNRGRCAATSLRTFARFLVASGKVEPGIEAAIPAIRKWRLASLPGYFTAAEVDRVIGSCDVDTPLGIRDRAIILLTARLGLRAGDVADLRLRSLDLPSSSITVSGKSRREVRLPLTQEVGDAIIRYLTDGRPKAQSEWLFLRVAAPVGPITSSAVSWIARSAQRRAGVRTARFGAHVLRYSAATQMMRDGVSLDGVASLLRHKSIRMTAHYAKIDVDLLRTIVQPWPEVRP